MTNHVLHLDQYLSMVIVRTVYVPLFPCTPSIHEHEIESAPCKATGMCISTITLTIQLDSTALTSHENFPRCIACTNVTLQDAF